VIRSTVQYVLNIELSDESWDQATLPVDNGGLGILRATDIAAFLAFLALVVGSYILTCQLRLQQLHGVAGTNELSFTAAVFEWQSQLQYSLRSLQHRMSGTYRW